MIPFRDDVPARRYPAITVLLIVTNLLVFAYQLWLPSDSLEQFIYRFGVVPASVLSFWDRPVAAAASLPQGLLGSMFLHGGWLHLIGNMWYLWIFGDNVEDRMGHIRFLGFYLLCGLAASSAHIFMNPSSSIPSIGASGAIAGVLGAYLVSYPFARILTIIPLFLFWPIVELPAILVLGFWFVVQLLNGSAAIAASAQTTGGIAWWAHIGGFAAGIVLLGLFVRRPAQRYSW